MIETSPLPVPPVAPSATPVLLVTAEWQATAAGEDEMAITEAMIAASHERMNAHSGQPDVTYVWGRESG